MWYGEVHVFIRVRHHGTDVPLRLVEQPAPIGGGEIRLPDQRDVAPSKEVPDETFPAKVVSRKGAGTFDDGLRHLQSPQGPKGWPVVSQHPVGVPRRWPTHGGARTTAHPIAGSSSTPRGTRRAHHWSAGERVAGEEHTIMGPYVQAPFKSPEDVHFLDRRVIRRSQVVHGERAKMRAAR